MKEKKESVCLTCGGNSSDGVTRILVIERVQSDRVVCFWQQSRQLHHRLL